MSDLRADRSQWGSANFYLLNTDGYMHETHSLVGWHASFSSSALLGRYIGVDFRRVAFQMDDTWIFIYHKPALSTEKRMARASRDAEMGTQSRVRGELATRPQLAFSTNENIKF